MYEFLTFRKMITPIIIQVLFWLGVVASVIYAVIIVIIGLSARPVTASSIAMGLIGGLLALVIGPILVRLYCELLILFFRMNETLTEIKQELEKP